MRRSKPKVVWLPPDQTGAPPNNPETGYQVVTVETTADGGGVIGIGELPIVIDAPPDQTIASLSDMENSSYRLRRIVGKIFIFGDAFDEESGIEVLIVTAALIVRRVSDGGSSLASQADNQQIRPANAINWPDPWIWRRSWLLGNQQTAPGPGPLLPFSNLELGSVSDGPHVDQKTARIIGPEERLFLDISTTPIIGPGQGELSHTVTVVTDLRVLATMKTSQGNRRNSSR